MARSLSASAHQKALTAATALIAERGIEATSMDAIARSSGVSKATLYKHWEDKEALLLEVLEHITGIHSRPDFITGDTRRDIIAVLAYRPQQDTSLRERIMPHLIAYSATRPEFGLVWRNRIMDPPRRELRTILIHAIEQGQIISSLDFDTALAILLGPMMYAFVIHGKTGAGISDSLAVAVAEAFLKAFAASTDKTKPAAE